MMLSEMCIKPPQCSFHCSLHSFRSSSPIMANNGSFPPPSIPPYAAGTPRPPHQPPHHPAAPPYGGYAGSSPSYWNPAVSGSAGTGFPTTPPTYGVSFPPPGGYDANGYPALLASSTYQVHAGTPAPGAGFPLQYVARPLPYPQYQANAGATGVGFPPPGDYAPPPPPIQNPPQAPQHSLAQAMGVAVLGQSVGGAIITVLSSFLE